MNFRLATENDLNKLFEIDSVVFKEPGRRKEIADWVGKGECFIAERSGTIVAYAALNYNFFHRGFIEMLMVDKNSRQQGIGEAFLNYLSSICKTDTLWTSTNQSNQPMQKLLARTGFRESGRIDNLDEGDPELVFYMKVSKEN